MTGGALMTTPRERVPAAPISSAVVTVIVKLPLYVYVWSKANVLSRFKVTGRSPVPSPKLTVPVHESEGSGSVKAPVKCSGWSGRATDGPARVVMTGAVVT